MKTERKVKVYEAPTSDGKTPMIKLQGAWLKEIGYNIGDPLKVTIADGKISIEHDPDQPEPEPKKRYKKL